MNDIWRQLELLFAAESRSRMAGRSDAKNDLVSRFEKIVAEAKLTLDHLLFVARSTSAARLELSAREQSDFDQRNFELAQKIDRLTNRFRELAGPPELSEDAATVTTSQQELTAQQVGDYS